MSDKTVYIPEPGYGGSKPPKRERFLLAGVWWDLPVHITDGIRAERKEAADRIAELEGLLKRWLTAPYGDLRDESIKALRGE